MKRRGLRREEEEVEAKRPRHKIAYQPSKRGCALENRKVLPAFNVILMDPNMPTMDGLTTEHIRQINPDVPIIALTSNALRGEKQTYQAKGLNAYAAKPLHRQQLVGLLWSGAPLDPSLAGLGCRQGQI